MNLFSLKDFVTVILRVNSEDTSLCGKIIDVKITKSFDDYCDAELV